MTADELAAAVGTAAAHELDSALNRIKPCLGQAYQTSDSGSIQVQ